MTPRHLLYVACAGFLAFSLMTFAQSPGSGNAPSQSSQTQKPTPTEQRIYGSQLMTPEERTAYMEKMHAARTPEERQKLRAEHHKEMQTRAKEKGITLPEQAPQQQHGMGMGPGMHMGPGPVPGPNAPQDSSSGAGK